MAQAISKIIEASDSSVLSYCFLLDKKSPLSEILAEVKLDRNEPVNRIFTKEGVVEIYRLMFCKSNKCQVFYAMYWRKTDGTIYSEFLVATIEEFAVFRDSHISSQVSIVVKDIKRNKTERFKVLI